MCSSVAHSCGQNTISIFVRFKHTLYERHLHFGRRAQAQTSGVCPKRLRVARVAFPKRSCPFRSLFFYFVTNRKSTGTPLIRNKWRCIYLLVLVFVGNHSYRKSFKGVKLSFTFRYSNQTFVCIS